MSIAIPIVSLFTLLLTMIGIWKLFSKANIPGIFAFIPIVNFFLLFKVAGQSPLRGFLLIIPLVNIIILVILYNDLAKIYNKGLLYIFGLLFLPFIFFPLLGFRGRRIDE